MMLDKKEIIKLVLFGIPDDEYTKLKELFEKDNKNGNFPSYDDISKAKGTYGIDEALIYHLDDTKVDQKNRDDLLKQIKETAYDLRLGEQYLLGEKISKLDSTKKPILKIPPHDVAVVLTYETLKIPTQVVGIFELNLKFVLKGLMLVNGAQVAPNYNGKLACVLFNLTNKPILLRYKEPFAKISFLSLVNPSKYKGEHQGYTKIQEFIGDSMPTSGLADISSKIEDYHKDFDKHRRDIEDKIRNATIIILTVISISLAIYNIFGKK
ncbi:MAG: hypothetical protein OIN86_07150 [Candidatus Methanoperedens sp.]|nr:hypothetical protein [Candidatus Methanoperedens sp.]